MTILWSPAPVLVAGPCVVESDPVNLVIATHLAELSTKLGLRVVYKASFDKANRADARSPRGPGIDRGLAALCRVREASGLPVLTDVHEVWQVEAAAAVVDALQIPAFLCRQTDLLRAVGRTGRPVNIKKGQWMAPEAMGGAVEKVRGAGRVDLAVTERGTFFGYCDLVVDMRNFARLREATGAPVIFDATHAVQQPGRGPHGSSGGSRADVPALLAAAAAAGADGFFLETHPDPASALSDPATTWPLAELEEVVERALSVWHAAREKGTVPWLSR
ncbi:MAG: 3-deoxy-8-phosphooctulonate synthase [Gemmatimonadales bacterium]|nr:3-deoxy-8-phosphooctulonate synthase [Gemmatimonadales bacterium]NIN11633.1 3-deoxy-8-phosphooctulonate synthase [Gemmatimonadales bacterium]NIN50239.1 3-deoxy-8-phosphooctulonate synthase [Gemmatimonadales bacterium]NIP07703.1 3-deoxy-8-phosphooctulonate synthase [Gemmatimonadales bacterium]NIR01855.1 3-deoxy-8-phosphooctulonate synthase [Gemmatimonadales bacterium]